MATYLRGIRTTYRGDSVDQVGFANSRLDARPLLSKSLTVISIGQLVLAERLITSSSLDLFQA
jgi:hypothetical protein